MPARARQRVQRIVLWLLVGAALTYCGGAALALAHGDGLHLLLSTEQPDVASWPYPTAAAGPSRTAFVRLATRWNDWDVLYVANLLHNAYHGRRYGWPVRVLMCWQETPATFPGANAEPWRWGIRSRFSGGHDAVVPLCPVWPGFAINTLFYAAVARGLWQVPMYIRRRHRLKHNRCTACGYSRTGLPPTTPCPECGHV